MSQNKGMLKANEGGGARVDPRVSIYVYMALLSNLILEVLIWAK